MATSSLLSISLRELCTCTSISEEQVLGLIEEETILPEGGATQEEWRFSVTAVSVAKKAARLHRELVADWEDILLVLQLLNDLTELRLENDRLRRRLARFESAE